MAIFLYDFTIITHGTNNPNIDIGNAEVDIADIGNLVLGINEAMYLYQISDIAHANKVPLINSLLSLFNKF